MENVRVIRIFYWIWFLLNILPISLTRHCFVVITVKTSMPHDGKGRKRHQSNRSPPTMSQSQTKRTKHSDQATPSVSVPDSATSVANFLSSVTDPIVRESLVTLVRDCIQPLQQEITQLRAIHENHAAEIASLSDQLVTTRDELNSVKSAYQLACDKLADLQQYTRRNALQITQSG